MITLSIGYPQEILNVVTYALPARAVHLFAPVGDNIQFSNDNSVWLSSGLIGVPFTGTVSAAFLRSNGSNQTVIIKPV